MMMLSATLKSDTELFLEINAKDDIDEKVDPTTSVIIIDNSKRSPIIDRYQTMKTHSLQSYVVHNDRKGSPTTTKIHEKSSYSTPKWFGRMSKKEAKETRVERLKRELEEAYAAADMPNEFAVPSTNIKADNFSPRYRFSSPKHYTASSPSRRTKSLSPQRSRYLNGSRGDSMIELRGRSLSPITSDRNVTQVHNPTNNDDNQSKTTDKYFQSASIDKLVEKMKNYFVTQEKVDNEVDATKTFGSDEIEQQHQRHLSLNTTSTNITNETKKQLNSSQGNRRSSSANKSINLRDEKIEQQLNIKQGNRRSSSPNKTPDLRDEIEQQLNLTQRNRRSSSPNKTPDLRDEIDQQRQRLLSLNTSTNITVETEHQLNSRQGNRRSSSPNKYTNVREEIEQQLNLTQGNRRSSSANRPTSIRDDIKQQLNLTQGKRGSSSPNKSTSVRDETEQQLNSRQGYRRSSPPNKSNSRQGYGLSFSSNYGNGTEQQLNSRQGNRLSSSPHNSKFSESMSNAQASIPRGPILWENWTQNQSVENDPASFSRNVSTYGDATSQNHNVKNNFQQSLMTQNYLGQGSEGDHNMMSPYTENQIQFNSPINAINRIQDDQLSIRNIFKNNGQHDNSSFHPSDSVSFYSQNKEVVDQSNNFENQNQMPASIDNRYFGERNSVAVVGDGTVSLTIDEESGNINIGNGAQSIPAINNNQQQPYTTNQNTEYQRHNLGGQEQNIRPEEDNHVYYHPQKSNKKEISWKDHSQNFDPDDPMHASTKNDVDDTYKDRQPPLIVDQIDHFNESIIPDTAESSLMFGRDNQNLGVGNYNLPSQRGAFSSAFNDIVDEQGQPIYGSMDNDTQVEDFNANRGVNVSQKEVHDNMFPDNQGSQQIHETYQSPPTMNKFDPVYQLRHQQNQESQQNHETYESTTMNSYDPVNELDHQHSEVIPAQNFGHLQTGQIKPNIPFDTAYAQNLPMRNMSHQYVLPDGPNNGTRASVMDTKTSRGELRSAPLKSSLRRGTQTKPFDFRTNKYGSSTKSFDDTDTKTKTLDSSTVYDMTGSYITASNKQTDNKPYKLKIRLSESSETSSYPGHHRKKRYSHRTRKLPQGGRTRDSSQSKKTRGSSHGGRTRDSSHSRKTRRSSRGGRTRDSFHDRNTRDSSRSKRTRGSRSLSTRANDSRTKTRDSSRRRRRTIDSYSSASSSTRSYSTRSYSGSGGSSSYSSKSRFDSSRGSESSYYSDESSYTSSEDSSSRNRQRGKGKRRHYG